MNEAQYETRKFIDQPIMKTYQYGSRVYGSHHKDSDYDFIVVVKSDEELKYTVNLTNSSFIVYSEELFIQKIKEHEISILECIFQEPNDEYRKHFVLDKEILRRSISSVASNSYCKYRKKLNQGDIYIGKKSLFHSLRILGFGIQIALTGRIVNYSAYNHFSERIMIMPSSDWKVYQTMFQPVYNRLKTNFKTFAPLDNDK